MRAIRTGFLLTGVIAMAQTPSGPQAGGASMRQLMLDLIHPAANEILLFVNRGAPKGDQEWAPVRRSALTLAETANLLTMPGRARDQGAWLRETKRLGDAGKAAYQAAQAKDFAALAAVTDALDASCTGCHKQYRPNVFPREGGSQ